MLLAERKKNCLCSHKLFIYWHHVVQYDALGSPTTWSPDYLLLNAPYLVSVIIIIKNDEGGGTKKRQNNS